MPCLARAVLVLLTGVVLPLTAAPPATPTAKDALRGLRPGHPRLFLTEPDLTALRSRASRDARLADWIKTLRPQAVKLLAQPVSTYSIPDGKRLLATSRRVFDRTVLLGFFYRLDHDKRFLDRAWKELEAVCAFKDWNPSHFLDTGEMSLAVAIGYDWMYADWTPAQRQTLREALVRHGLRLGAAAYAGKGSRGHSWWARVRHNWNQVCNGGMLAAALALAEDEPALASQVVAGALSSIRLAMDEYAPDGAYKEGVGYWCYGTGYNVYFLAALESALGTDFGLSKLPGFEQTGLFVPTLTGPTGSSYNFADAGKGRVRNLSTVRWLAERFKHAGLLTYVNREGTPTVWDVLWHRTATPPNEPLPLVRHWPGAQVASLRTAWNDPTAAFVAFKGGSPRDNHAQADLGSFIYEAQGVRWAIDLGADNYNLPGYFDGATGRWRFYRNRAEGHNTLVLGSGDKADQVLTSRCHITRFGDEKNPYGVIDLTKAYPAAQRVERGIRLSPAGTLLVRDEIALSRPQDVRWFLHTEAKIQLSEAGRTAVLTQGGKTLRVHLIEPAEAVFTAGDAIPLPDSPTVKGQAENKGVRKLAIHLPGVRSARLSVQLGGDAAAPQVAPLTDWK